MMNVDKSPKNEEEFSLFATSQKKFHSKAALEYSFRIEEMFTTTPMNALFLRPSSLSSSSSRDADLLAKKE